MYRILCISAGNLLYDYHFCQSSRGIDGNAILDKLNSLALCLFFGKLHNSFLRPEPFRAAPP